MYARESMREGVCTKEGVCAYMRGRGMERGRERLFYSMIIHVRQKNTCSKSGWEVESYKDKKNPCRRQVGNRGTFSSHLDLILRWKEEKREMLII